jgi:hypothetical protein
VSFSFGLPPLNSFLAKDSSAMLLDAKYRGYRVGHLGFSPNFLLLTKCQPEI